MAVAEKTSRDVKLFASLASLEMIMRGGRVSPAQARVATLLGLHPVFTIGEDGRSAKAGTHLGFAASLRGLVKRAERFAAGRPVRLLIAHASAIGAAEYVAERLCSRFGVADIPIVNLTPVLAAHAGPGAVALAVRRMDG